MLTLAPTRLRPPMQFSESSPASPRKRVALLSGCVQSVLGSHIHEATVRLLSRHGCAVTIVSGSGCCGALTHHLGQDARSFARANIDAWLRERDERGLDAIVVNASGCGTMVKDYGFLFRDDPVYSQRAREMAAMTRDVTELMTELGLSAPIGPKNRRIAYHAACSLQHGQSVRKQPKDLLAAAGFEVVEPPESHLCCGSAGIYNVTQPEIAGRLRERKVKNLASVSPEIIATGNIGCIVQIAGGTATPVVHTVELLDWATGGPPPSALAAAAPNSSK